MVDVAEIRLWGDLVGAVSWSDSRSVASFEYTPEFAASGLELAPFTMPLDTNRIYSFPELGRDAFRGLPGLLADSLPDRWGTDVFNQWLASQGRPIDSYNPVERLMYVGIRGMGALEYRPAKRGMGRSEAVSAESLADVASAVLVARKGIDVEFTDEGLKALLQVGTSAGGLRAKAVVAWNPETQEMRSGQVKGPKGFGYWIIKFDGIGSTDGAFTDPKGYGRVEMAYYLMATEAGVQMSPSILHVDGGGRAHFMTRRFDRLDDGSKIHAQTYQALTHRDYNETGRHSWELALQTTTELCGFGATAQLFRRMVFNVVARNQDDHTKNIGYSMGRDGVWTLAPAYDMTYANNPQSPWTSRHQMTINGKQTDIDTADLISVAEAVGVRKARRIVTEVIDAVREWDTFASEAGVSDRFRTTIGSELRTDIAG